MEVQKVTLTYILTKKNYQYQFLALALDDKIGNFEVGKEFDALIIDMEVGTCEYQLDRSPFEILQQFIYSGDDRNILNVFVAGKLVK